MYAILDNYKFVGMCYIVNCDGAYYLMYLAIQDELRNKKYGSKILEDLKEKYKTLFLSIDKPTDEISIKRKNFYLRNGFYDTNKYYEDTGVLYEVLCTNSQYEITENIMQKRYTNMTSNTELSRVISNTFNVDTINLKEKGYDDEYCNICLTHSYLNNDVLCTAGGIPDDIPFRKEFIKNHEYTIEEKIINLCDLMCHQNGVVYTIDKRLIDIMIRRGAYSNKIKKVMLNYKHSK